MKKILATFLAFALIMTTFTACAEVREKLLEILEKEVEDEVTTNEVTDSEIESNADADMSYNTDGSWYESEYDENGNEIKRTYYYGDGSVWYWCEYLHLSDGGWFEFINNSDGNMVKAASYDADGNINWWDEYEYDLNGNVTMYIAHNADSSVDFCEEYEYDSNGNQTKYKSYNSDGSIDSWYEYEYDSENNVTKIREYNSDGSYDEYDALVVPNTATYVNSGDSYSLTFGEYSNGSGLVSYSDATNSKNNYDGTYVVELNDAGISSVITITTDSGKVVELVYDATMDAMQDLDSGTVYYGSDLE